MVGPLLPKPPAPLPEKFERFVSSSGEAGVILVSFGSMMSSPPQEVVETLAKAFGRLKQKVIWKINGERRCCFLCTFCTIVNDSLVKLRRL